MEPDLRAGTVCLVLIWSRLVLLAHSQVYCPDLCNCYDNIDPDGYTYTVDCSYGEITSIPGFIPVNTTHLDLSYNYIGKVRKSDLAGLSMLVFLQLHDNLIAEIEPGSFSDLTSLQALFIYDNNIRELAAGALAGLGSLLELDAHNMHLKSFAGGVFSPLSSAYYIDLSDNRLGTLPPNAFTGLPKLQTLILNGSYIQSIQTAAFTNLPSLQVLNLDDNGLMHVAQAAFVSLPSIHTISLQMNQFVCDCDAVWLYGWLVKKGVAGPLCTYPAPLLGRPLLQLKPQDICRPPSVAMATPPYVVLNQSATLLLFCNASGAPPPKVHWSVNGFTFYPNDTRVTSNDTSLKIANVGVNDSGMYYCCASSGSLSVSSSVYVTVLDVVSENNISSIAAYVGTTAQVPCVIRPLPVPLPVTWMFQKNVLQASPKYTITANSTLLVNNTSLSDGGLYQCVVGGATVLMRRVTVIAPPTITRFLHGPCSSPQSISLNTSSVGDFVCDAFGSPPPSIQWLYNGAPLSPSNPVDTYYSPRVVQSANMTRTFLTSQNIIGGVMVIGTEVGGNYTCVASNPYGSDVKSTLVDIVAALQPPAQITISMKPIDAFVKQYLVLPCVVVAPVNVSVSITWSGPTPIPSDAFVTSSNSLVFVEPMGGRYTCHTQGGGASFNIEYDISIQNPPLIVKECPVPVVSCLLGQTAWLFCNATGAPPPQVTWYMGGVMIQSSGRYKVGPLGYPGALVISMATIEDTGVYTCVASNSYNEMDSYTISLQVLKRPYFTQSPSSVGVAKTAPAQLQCSGAGLPLPAVTWWKVNSTISMATQVQPSNGTVISSEYLVILRASVLDMGYYYCNLSSPVGVVTSPQAYINVYTAPVFMSSPSEVKTVEGTTNVSLPCPASSNPSPTITWYFNNLFLPLPGKQTVDPYGNLTVLHVTPQDGGVYTCIAASPGGVMKHTVTLSVKVLPQASVAPPNTTVNESCQVMFSCLDHGAPPTNFLWLFDGNPLNDSDHVTIRPMGMLIITNVGPSDGGNYTCTVWGANISEASSSTAVLAVHAPVMDIVLPSIISPTPSSQLIPETGTAQFVCVAMGDPPPSLVWMFNGGPIRNLIRIAVSQDTLTVQLLRSTDSGTYACIANNTHGTTYKTFQLDVAVSPQFTEVPIPITLQEGRRLSLPCAAYGYPNPGILWFKDDRQLTSPVLDPSTQALQVYNTTPGDSGTYTCLARNFAGVIQYSVAIIIEPTTVPPTIVAPPISTVVAVGASVALDCVVDGVPPPKVTWFKDTVRLFSSSDVMVSPRSVYIRVANVSDSGVYMCVAENRAGMAAYQASITVAPALPSVVQTTNVFTMPPYFTTTPKDISAPLGSTLSLHCQANGSPTPQISWLFNNHPLLLFGSGDNIVAYDDGTLVITVLTRSDLGDYICTAGNTWGQSQTVATVTEAAQTVFPQFDILPHGALQVYNGDNLTLDCGATGYPVPSIMWQKDGRPVDGSGQQNITITQNHSLVIQSISPSQSGQYTCVAGSVVGVAHAIVVVEVVPRPPSPPTVTIPTPNTTVLAGAMVVLACQVDGWPTPLMAWFNGSTPVDGGGTRVVNGSLVFRRASVYDHGSYTCAALNINGVNEATVHLTVLPRPEPPFITHTLVDTLVVQGGYALFPCEATSYQGTPTIQWAFNGLPLVPSQQWNVLSDNSLLLTAVTLNDTGTYSCMASNQYGTSVANVTVWVLRTPINASVVALAGSGVQLTCNLTGTVVWTKDGNPVMTSSRVMLVTSPPQKLYILIVQSSDEGEYQCAGGGRFMGIFLQVTVKPTINTQSGFFFGSPGSTVMLPCQASGQPLPQLSWVWQGKPLQADSHYGLLYNGSLLVYSVGVADGGDYTCVVQNTAGTAQSTVTLVVL